MSLKGLHLIHSFALLFNVSVTSNLSLVVYIYSRCLLSPNIWIFAACIVWNYTLGIWQLASQHHHILHHTAVICYDLFVLLRYEMLHSLPIYHHCIWLHQLFYVMSSWQYKSTCTKPSRFGIWQMIHPSSFNFSWSPFSCDDMLLVELLFIQ